MSTECECGKTPDPGLCNCSGASHCACMHDLSGFGWSGGVGSENPIIRYAEMPDGPEFDEFIAHDARVHFEVMGDAQFWLMVTVGERSWHINCGAKSARAKGYASCEEDVP